MLIITKVLFILGFICLFYATQETIGDSSCSFISGQGCMGGICKFCGMCLPSGCILATPYSTGNNAGSTCAATHQTSDGYDFYNYCLSSGTDTDGDQCDTSTQCYPYQQSNSTLMQAIFNDLTCDPDTCLLIMSDGSPLPAPMYLNTTSNTSTSSATSSTPSSDLNSTTTHPAHGTGRGNRNPHYNQFDIKSGSAQSIAVTTVCAVVSVCLFIWLIRFCFYKTKYWRFINKYGCCGLCPYKPRTKKETDNRSSSSIETPNSHPPSFCSNILYSFMPNNNSSISNSNSCDRSNSLDLGVRQNNSRTSLPSYNNQDPSPPKYEQAIVSQIRGLRFLDHDPDDSDSSVVQNRVNNEPIWVPVYFNRNSATATIPSSFATFISPNSQDWATQTIRHQPSTSGDEEDTNSRR